MTTFLSERGLPLIWSADGFPKGDAAVVTVEAYVKWYGLYLVDSEGPRRDKYTRAVLRFPFPDDAAYVNASESAYADHVPNPAVVCRWAKANNYDVDPLALELMVGRWELEARHRYDHLNEIFGG